MVIARVRGSAAHIMYPVLQLLVRGDPKQQEHQNTQKVTGVLFYHEDVNRSSVAHRVVVEVVVGATVGRNAVVAGW